MSESGRPPRYDDVFGNQFKEIGVRDDYLDDLKQLRSQKERLDDDQLNRLPKLEKSGPARLDRLVERAHDKQETEYNRKKIYNMSLLEIYRHTSETLITILDELLHITYGEPIGRIMDIFTSGDRLVSLGIVTMLFTLLFILIDS